VAADHMTAGLAAWPSALPGPKLAASHAGRLSYAARDTEGRKEPAKMTNRSDDAEGTEVPPPGGDVPERVAVVGKLGPGSRERASQIIAEGAPYDLGEAGFRRHSVFLAEEAVVFVFEAWASKSLSATSSTTPPARTRSASGDRFSRGHRRLPGRSSTGAAG
jgi:hypothetical protein